MEKAVKELRGQRSALDLLASRGFEAYLHPTTGLLFAKTLPHALVLANESYGLNYANVRDLAHQAQANCRSQDTPPLGVLLTRKPGTPWLVHMEADPWLKHEGLVRNAVEAWNRWWGKPDKAGPEELKDVALAMKLIGGKDVDGEGPL